jgi:hypothetical protein
MRNLTKNDSYSQELSFKTLKQNIFWGKLIQKNDIASVIWIIPYLKVAKSANYLREEQWLGRGTENFEQRHRKAIL